MSGIQSKIVRNIKKDVKQGVKCRHRGYIKRPKYNFQK